MPRLPALYTQLVFCLLGLAAGTAGGLQLIRWRAFPIAGREAARTTTNVHFPYTPDPEVLQTWTTLFDGAQREISLATGRLDSETVIRALDSAARRGVGVHILLGPAQNQSPSSGSRGWLHYRTTLTDVAIAHAPLEGTACVIDGDKAAITPQELTEESTRDGSVFLFSKDAAVAAPLHQWLEERFAAGIR